MSMSKNMPNSPPRKKRRESGYFAASSPFPMPRTPATPATPGTPMIHSAYSPMANNLHSVATTTYSESEDEDELDLDNAVHFVELEQPHPLTFTTAEIAHRNRANVEQFNRDLSQEGLFSNAINGDPNPDDILNFDELATFQSDSEWVSSLIDLSLDLQRDLQGPSQVQGPVPVPQSSGDSPPLPQSPNVRENRSFNPYDLPESFTWDDLEIQVSVFQRAFNLKCKASTPQQRLQDIFSEAGKILVDHLFTEEELKKQTFSGRKHGKKLDPIRLAAILRLLAHLMNCWEKGSTLKNSLPTDYKEDLQCELSISDAKNFKKKAFIQFRNQVNQGRTKLGSGQKVPADKAGAGLGIEWTHGKYFPKSIVADVFLHLYLDQPSLAGKILYKYLFTEEERRDHTPSGRNGTQPLDPFKVEVIFEILNQLRNKKKFPYTFDKIVPFHPTTGAAFHSSLPENLREGWKSSIFAKPRKVSEQQNNPVEQSPIVQIMVMEMPRPIQEGVSVDTSLPEEDVVVEPPPSIEESVQVEAPQPQQIPTEDNLWPQNDAFIFPTFTFQDVIDQSLTW